MENLQEAQGSSARVVSSHHYWALHLTVQVKLQGRTLYKKNSRMLKKKIGHCNFGPVSLVKPSYGLEIEQVCNISHLPWTISSCC